MNPTTRFLQTSLHATLIIICWLPPATSGRIVVCEGWGPDHVGQGQTLKRQLVFSARTPAPDHLFLLKAIRGQCGDLTKLRLADATVTSAKLEAAGNFTPASGPR